MGEAGSSCSYPSHPWPHGPVLQAKSQFKRRSTANNVEIHIPVPNDADSPKFKTTVGSVKWVPENSEIVWSIKSFPVRTVLSGVPSRLPPTSHQLPVPWQQWDTPQALRRGMGLGSAASGGVRREGAESRRAGWARRESWSLLGQRRLAWLCAPLPPSLPPQHQCSVPAPLLPSFPLPDTGVGTQHRWRGTGCLEARTARVSAIQPQEQVALCALCLLHPLARTPGLCSGF